MTPLCHNSAVSIALLSHDSAVSLTLLSQNWAVSMTPLSQWKLIFVYYLMQWLNSFSDTAESKFSGVIDNRWVKILSELDAFKTNAFKDERFQKVTLSKDNAFKSKRSHMVNAFRVTGFQKLNESKSRGLFNRTVVHRQGLVNPCTERSAHSYMERSAHLQTKRWRTRTGVSPLFHREVGPQVNRVLACFSTEESADSDTEESVLHTKRGQPTHKQKGWPTPTQRASHSYTEGSAPSYTEGLTHSNISHSWCSQDHF
jgi:hypothetical protein